LHQTCIPSGPASSFILTISENFYVGIRTMKTI
jgi:hypothetical protein